MRVRMRRFEDRVAPKDRRRMRKGMYILPSLFTAFNIAAGYYAITEAMQGSLVDARHFDIAAIAIGIAIVADGLDGRIARMTGTTSAFGREFDSLADVITFGVAPALLAWLWGFRWLLVFGNPELRARIMQLGVIASFLFLVAGAARLARFNIQINPQPSNPGRPGRKYFVGMPIPAGAGVIAATIHLFNGWPIEYPWFAWVWMGLLVVVGFLMVSTWRFYSFKDLNLRNRQPFQLLILIAVFLMALAFLSRYLLFFIAITYMLSGIMTRVSALFRRRPAEASPPAAYEEATEPR